MYTFKDYYGNTVELSFDDHPYASFAKHVWVVCKHQGKWLLTKHKHRGLEFPGGKVEEGETSEEAAIREVKEETGGEVSALFYLGQYKVNGREKVIVKNIYHAVVDDLQPQPHYFETLGPVLMDKLPKSLKKDNRFSFIMRDDVLVHSINKIASMNINSMSK
ncbi:RNA deprotection pyrophosphohydrolase [Priestia taiwanensis]|uniref:8-oxo-dGTP diphosphatase YtkD n=1 Tax=Priestia taiwanensis TaxID=1347902 RepID=A0A917ERM3_9BACI|nr:nucleoside triphosphatase YtkD [Priestia taiwanensis]GGE77962.1 putative 8-oxo-dGTP diphosphatase YtkD [Priestia taiwanensis]